MSATLLVENLYEKIIIIVSEGYDVESVQPNSLIKSQDT